jgi:hypothetical protein
MVPRQLTAGWMRRGVRPDRQAAPPDAGRDNGRESAPVALPNKKIENNPMHSSQRLPAGLYGFSEID